MSDGRDLDPPRRYPMPPAAAAEPLPREWFPADEWWRERARKGITPEERYWIDSWLEDLGEQQRQAVLSGDGVTHAMIANHAVLKKLRVIADLMAEAHFTDEDVQVCQRLGSHDYVGTIGDSMEIAHHEFQLLRSLADRLARLTSLPPKES